MYKVGKIVLVAFQVPQADETVPGSLYLTTFEAPHSVINVYKGNLFVFS
jgi:hypothetical protein